VEHTISTSLRLNTSQFTAGLGMAAGQVKAFGRDIAGVMGTAQQKTSAAFKGIAGASDEHLKTIGTAGLVMGGAVVAGFGLAAGAAMSFDKQMSEVGAVAEASGDQLGQLRQAALDAGQATVFSASQAAQAQAELAKAGVQTRDILGGGLTGALDLAAAGSIGLADAAGFAATAMNTFKLQGSDVPRIADTLAAGANKSATDVAEMGQALQQAGAQANLMRLPFEETVATLAIFAQSGVRGSDAGTSLKNMLMRLTPTSKEAADAMAQVGLDFYDANEQFIGMSATAQMLKEKLGPLSEEQRNLALNTIFGTDASRAAVYLMEQGAAGVDGWTDSVSESGYAAELAGKKTDNLAGDLETLKGSFETTLIQGGSQATDALRFLTQGITGVVDGLGAMPAPLQTAFLGATGIIGLGSAAVGVYGTLKPKIDTFKASLEGLGGIGPKIASNLGGIGLAAGGVGIALTGVALIYGYFAQQQAEAEQRAKDFITTLDAQTGAITANTTAKVRSDLEEKNRIDNLNQAKVTVEDFTSALDDNSQGILEEIRLMSEMGSVSQISGERRASLIGQLRAEGGERNNLIATLMEQGALDQGLLGQIIAQSDAYDAQQVALRESNIQKSIATGKTREQATAEADAAVRTNEHTEAIKAAAEELRASVDPWYGAYRAQQSLAEAQRTYNETVAEFGASSPQAVDAYVALTDAGFGFEGQLLNLAGAQSEGETSAADLAARLEGLRAYGIDPAAAAALIAGGKFNDLAAAAQAADDKNVDIPVAADTEPARRAIEDFVVWANGRRFTIPGSIAAPSVIAGGGAGTPGGFFYRRDEANGGVLDFAAYANGGIRAAERYANGGEHHVAQIARPGTTRIWNEPETGGEAYIPMAASKRPRALQVLNMVADRFNVAGGGGTVVHLSISAPIHAPGADPGSVRAIRRELELVIDGATDRIARNLGRRDRSIT
jgi:TP901 family phage tail tape measure protein